MPYVFLRCGKGARQFRRAACFYVKEATDPSHFAKPNFPIGSFKKLPIRIPVAMGKIGLEQF